MKASVWFWTIAVLATGYGTAFSDCLPDAACYIFHRYTFKNEEFCKRWRANYSDDVRTDSTGLPSGVGPGDIKQAFLDCLQEWRTHGTSDLPDPVWTGYADTLDSETSPSTCYVGFYSDDDWPWPWFWIAGTQPILDAIAWGDGGKEVYSRAFTMLHGGIYYWGADCSIYPGCTYQFDIRNVLTHEMGHWWGLADIDGDECGPATMAAAPSGTISQRTLDTPDIQGIQTLYKQPIPDDTATMFSDYGAFADTAFCETRGQKGTTAIILRGYTSAGNYPSIGDTLALITSSPDLGSLQHYVVNIPSGYVVFRWSERDSAGEGSYSEPFGSADKPAGWADMYGTATVEGDSLGQGEALGQPDGYETPLEGMLTPDSTNCADIVVYSCYDSLASPVYNQIHADVPSARILKVVAPLLYAFGPPNTTAQACKDAIYKAWKANTTWDMSCDDPPPFWSCPRRFPSGPGPEVYIVGDIFPQYVGTGGFPDTTGTCFMDTCRSDYKLYDFDSDGLPEGPISRIPAKTVKEATRAAQFAANWNAGRCIDTGNHVVRLAGDSSMPDGQRDLIDGLLDGVGSEYSLAGYGTETVLRSRDYAVGNDSGKLSAFASQMNGGCAELFGHGGVSGWTLWPGAFLKADVSGLTAKQRFVAWLPGCNIHGTWANRTSIEMLMFNDTTHTGVAASVGNMEGGYNFQHLGMAEYLLQAREDAALANAGKSVARIAYDAVTSAIAAKPWLRTNAMTTSAWGSYTRVSPSPPNRITDASIAFVGRTTLVLEWTEPSQLGGNADSCQIRRLVGSSVNDANWTTAKIVSEFAPQAGGIGCCFDVDSLLASHTYYFGMRTKKGGLWSKVSNSPSATTHSSGSNVFCDDGSLVVVGSGNGGAPSRPLHGEALGPVAGEGGASSAGGRSLLWGRGVEVTDLCKIEYHASGADGSYGIQICDTGFHPATLAELSLGYVDHDPSVVTVAGTDRVYLGTLGALAAVRDVSGREPAELSQGSTSTYDAQAGEYLVVDLGDTATASGVVIEASAGVGGAYADSIGILVQEATALGEWSTLATVHPRHEFSQMAVDARGNRLLRLVFMHGYQIRSLLRLVNLSNELPQPLTLTRANQTGLGDVTSAIGASGGHGTTISPQDSIRLIYNSSPVGQGLVRDVFLTAKGSYSTPTSGVSQDLESDRPALSPPFAFDLGAASPNPSTGRVRFSFSMAREGSVLIRIYDVAGRLVKTLVNGAVDAGPHEIYWSASDDHGRKVGAGVYFYRMEAGAWRSQRKVVFLEH